MIKFGDRSLIYAAQGKRERKGERRTEGRKKGKRGKGKKGGIQF